jgi:cytochrome bd ubiquinol oxidase subunit II
MSTAGFIAVAFILTMYVLLDGYDLGVAAISPLIARTDGERGAAMESIGPFWNGNEVWLVAAAAVLFALFPAAYAASFSGFYLPFIVVLWLLMFRGIALELRERFSSELWHQFWDTSFSLASALLIFLFGLALGNMLRGVPINAAGYFQGTFAFLFNPYAALVGLFALAALGLHGAAFTAMRVDGKPAVRAMRILTRGWWIVLALYLAVTALTIAMRPPVASWVFAVPVISLLALGAQRRYASPALATRAFAASCVFLASLLAASAGTLYPDLLRGFPAGQRGITIFAASPSGASLMCAFVVTLVGVAAVAIYAPLVWRRMAEKIRVE